MASTLASGEAGARVVADRPSTSASAGRDPQAGRHQVILRLGGSWRAGRGNQQAGGEHKRRAMHTPSRGSIVSKPQRAAGRRPGTRGTGWMPLSSVAARTRLRDVAGA